MMNDPMILPTNKSIVLAMKQTRGIMKQPDNNDNDRLYKKGLIDGVFLN